MCQKQRGRRYQYAEIYSVQDSRISWRKWFWAHLFAAGTSQIYTFFYFFLNDLVLEPETVSIHSVATTDLLNSGRSLLLQYPDSMSGKITGSSSTFKKVKSCKDLCKEVIMSRVEGWWDRLKLWKYNQRLLRWQE